MIFIKKRINKFINEVNKKYPNLKLNYEYNKNENYHDVWHDNPDIDSNDNEFRNCVGNLIYKYFYSKKKYNIAFGYRYNEADFMK